MVQSRCLPPFAPLPLFPPPLPPLDCRGAELLRSARGCDARGCELRGSLRGMLRSLLTFGLFSIRGASTVREREGLGSYERDGIGWRYGSERVIVDDVAS